MLIEFSVSNYRSFREKQTFSMVAATRIRKKENVFTPAVNGERVPDLLKVAAIYGPNASGKTNLLRAMSVVPSIAMTNPSAISRSLPVMPFRFDKELATQPSRFELHFVHKMQRYQFELAVTSERIVEERLIAFPKGKETLLYTRLYLEAGEQYTFGNELEGGEDLHRAWQKLTGPKTLFISQAVANSSEELTQLKIPFEWLKEGIMVINEGMSGLANVAQNVAKKNRECAEEISSFLQDVDVPVTAMQFKSLPASHNTEVDSDNLPEEQSSVAHLNRLMHSRSKTMLTHRTALGEADFDFEEESEGTKGLIGFWLPWSLFAHKESPFRVFAVDELDSSLHPEIVANLVQKHLQNPAPAQLVFTTHDTHLMDTKLLRRDQFWLTERDVNGATQIRSIHEFDGRESEDIEKRYYAGRYRALPVLRKG